MSRGCNERVVLYGLIRSLTLAENEGDILESIREACRQIQIPLPPHQNMDELRKETGAWPSLRGER